MRMSPGEGSGNPAFVGLPLLAASCVWHWRLGRKLAYGGGKTSSHGGLEGEPSAFAPGTRGEILFGKPTNRNIVLITLMAVLVDGLDVMTRTNAAADTKNRHAGAAGTTNPSNEQFAVFGAVAITPMFAMVAIANPISATIVATTAVVAYSMGRSRPVADSTTGTSISQTSEGRSRHPIATAD